MERAIGAAVYLAGPGRKSDPGKPKYPVPLKRDAENSTVSGHIILDDGDIVHCGIRPPSTSNSRGALQRYRLRDPWTRSPAKRSRRKRDRITGHSLRVVNLLYVCRCSVGMVNGSSAAQGEQPAQNKYKPKNSSRHNCGLPILAIRRRRDFYQPWFSWQVKFFCFSNLFCKHPPTEPIQNFLRPLSKFAKLAPTLLQIFMYDPQNPHLLSGASGRFKHSQCPFCQRRGDHLS